MLAASGVIRYVTDDDQEYLVTSRSGAFDVKPLGYPELIAAVKDRVSVVLKIRNVNVTPVNSEDNLPRTISMPIEAEPIYGLIDGGWVPMPWAHKSIALLDSNMLIAIEQVVSGKRQRGGAIDRFLGLDVQRVSAILYALEGVSQRPVTESEFNAELNRAERALAEVLPDEKLEILNVDQRSAVYDLLRIQARSNAVKFVEAAAPLLADQVGVVERLALERRILELAAEHRVPVVSTVVTALLSCIYDGGGNISHRVQTPARAVIKPKRAYSSRAAYGAVADLYALEFLHNIHAVFPEHSCVFYTQDVGIAAMWAAMQPCQRQVIQSPGGHVNTRVTFPLDGGLFPALEGDKISQLKVRLGEFAEVGVK